MPDPDVARAQEVQAEAGAMPTQEQIRDLAARAIAHGGTRTMSLVQVRAKAAEATENARRLAELLGELSQLLEQEHPAAEDPGGQGGAGEP